MSAFGPALFAAFASRAFAKAFEEACAEATEGKRPHPYVVLVRASRSEHVDAFTEIRGQAERALQDAYDAYWEAALLTETRAAKAEARARHRRAQAARESAAARTEAARQLADDTLAAA